MAGHFNSISGSLSLHVLQVAREIARGILSGEFASGSIIPGEMALCGNLVSVGAALRGSG